MTTAAATVLNNPELLYLILEHLGPPPSNQVTNVFHSKAYHGQLCNELDVEGGVCNDWYKKHLLSCMRVSRVWFHEGSRVLYGNTLFKRNLLQKLLQHTFSGEQGRVLIYSSNDYHPDGKDNHDQIEFYFRFIKHACLALPHMVLARYSDSLKTLQCIITEVESVVIAMRKLVESAHNLEYLSVFVDIATAEIKQYECENNDGHIYKAGDDRDAVHCAVFMKEVMKRKLDTVEIGGGWRDLFLSEDNEEDDFSPVEWRNVNFRPQEVPFDLRSISMLIKKLGNNVDRLNLELNPRTLDSKPGQFMPAPDAHMEPLLALHDLVYLHVATDGFPISGQEIPKLAANSPLLKSFRMRDALARSGCKAYLDLRNHHSYVSYQSHAAPTTDKELCAFAGLVPQLEHFELCVTGLEVTEASLLAFGYGCRMLQSFTVRAVQTRYKVNPDRHDWVGETSARIRWSLVTFTKLYTMFKGDQSNPVLFPCLTSINPIPPQADNEPLPGAPSEVLAFIAEHFPRLEDTSQSKSVFLLYDI